MKKEWKEFTFNDLKYKISNYGEIIGARGKILKQRIDDDGYLEVTLGVESKRKSVKVHRLVALYFVDNPNNLLEVNHKDFNRANCRADNLEWITHQDNIKHSYEAGHYKGRFGKENPNYGNDALKRRFEEDPELRKVQSRPKEQNGRARKVRLIYPNGETVDFKYIGECAEYLIEKEFTKGKVDNVRIRISEAAKKKKQYKKLRFEFI